MKPCGSLECSDWQGEALLHRRKPDGARVLGDGVLGANSDALAHALLTRVVIDSGMAGSVIGVSSSPCRLGKSRLQLNGARAYTQMQLGDEKDSNRQRQRHGHGHATGLLVLFPQASAMPQIGGDIRPPVRAARVGGPAGQLITCSTAGESARIQPAPAARRPKPSATTMRWDLCRPPVASQPIPALYRHSSTAHPMIGPRLTLDETWRESIARSRAMPVRPGRF
jgi:hypothetical protein